MKLTTYYTEETKGRFQAYTDGAALMMTNAKLVCKESNTPDGTPFITIREYAP